MPSYNSEKTIQYSIQSIIDQDYRNWELLITDDKSTDKTLSILEEYKNKEKRIKVTILSKNSGAAIARNTSIENSQGAYIAFLDADDLWGPEKLKKQINFMEENNFDFTYTYYQKFTSNSLGSVIRAPSQVTYNKLLYSNCIGCLTAIYNSSHLGKIYMPEIRKRQDLGLWLNILKLTKTAYCFPENLAMYRTDSGMTQNKIKTAFSQWKFYRTTLKMGKTNSGSKMIIYTIKGLLKKIK